MTVSQSASPLPQSPLRPLLVGEDNPYRSDPDYALYPHPPESAGGRLCYKILRLDRKQYIALYDRQNLCSTRWSSPEARKSALRIAQERAGRVVVLFGAKVSEAFGRGEFRPFEVSRAAAATYVTLPHPSGRCRIWNEPGSMDRAREVLREAGAPVGPISSEEWLAILKQRRDLRVEGLDSTDCTTARPALCSNCHEIVEGRDCPDCGPTVRVA